ncbi:MAG: peroxiredoxin-like family protein [Actinomycetota bacterium]|nr:peroxiredoxin-like family protein [Actinomycetota bacterium]
MTDTLAQALKEQNEANRAHLPEAQLAVMDAATAALEASGLAQRSLAVGAIAPDFALPDPTGRRVALTSLLAEGPVVLSFYRGGWCPYCSTQLRALQTRLADISEAGGRLVAVSPQTPDHSLSTAEKLELAFPVLSDVGNTVARTYGLVFSLPEDLRDVYSGFGLDLPAANGDDTFELPLPATFVVGTDAKVAWRFVDSDYTRRAEPDDVIDALRSL